MAKVSSETWFKIKTDYEMSSQEETSNRGLAGKYGIDEKTLRNKIVSDNWTRNLRSKIIDIKDQIDIIRADIPHQQHEYFNSKLAEKLDLKQLVNEYMLTAIKLNTKNMKELFDAKDLQLRIRLTAQMRANMIDLASMNQNIKDSEETSDGTGTIDMIVIE